MRKLLKYDLKSLFPTWAISSVVVLAFYALGIFSLRGIIEMVNTPDNYEPPLAQIIYQLGSIGAFILTVIGFAAYPILNYVFILKRFYTHFYTDQGYLTFTLPVKRTQLMGSKLLSGMLCIMTTDLILLGGIAVVVLFGTSTEEIINHDILDGLAMVVQVVEDAVGGWLPVFVVEMVILLPILFASSLLFMYTCLTVGAVTAKKLKLLIAFLIYYVAESVMACIGQIIYLPVLTTSLPAKLETMDTQTLCLTGTLTLALIIAFAATIAWLLYYLNVRLLHKKLNLA